MRCQVRLFPGLTVGVACLQFVQKLVLFSFSKNDAKLGALTIKFKLHNNFRGAFAPPVNKRNYSVFHGFENMRSVSQNIARKVDSSWAVLIQMHSGISNKLSIISLFFFFFFWPSDWFTVHLPNRIVLILSLCFKTGGSKRKRILRVAE